MFRTMLKSKIHRATVTEADLEYEGSLTLDPQLMKEADLWPYEKVDIYNINNGARLSTYLIEGQSGKKTVCLNGAAARLVAPGDRVIICSYTQIDEKDLKTYQPTVLLLNENNEIQKIS